MYGEGVRGMDEEPGFMVVKKHVVSETSDDEPITERNVKEWEVRSRRISFLTCPKISFLCRIKPHRHGLWSVYDCHLIHNL